MNILLLRAFYTLYTCRHRSIVGSGWTFKIIFLLQINQIKVEGTVTKLRKSRYFERLTKYDRFKYLLKELDGSSLIDSVRQVVPQTLASYHERTLCVCGWVHASACSRACVCLCVHACLCVCVFACVYVCVYVYMSVHAFMFVYLCARVFCFS